MTFLYIYITVLYARSLSTVGSVLLDRIFAINLMQIKNKMELLMKTTLSLCGIDCQMCDALIAPQAQDEALFKKLAEQFQANFGKTIDPELLRCAGCKNEGPHISFCFECEIRKCAMDKGFETCAECGDLPCAKGQFIWIEGSVSLANLLNSRS